MKREISKIFENLPEVLNDPPKKFHFGTAGYRDISSVLMSCLCRASLLAYIRSATFCGKTIGIMITASHNPKCDNGIKIIDHNGEYIDKTLENYCDEIVNVPAKDLLKTLTRIHRKLGSMRDFGDGAMGVIAIGRDTRESGEIFEREITALLKKLPCTVINYGMVTTPQLHFLVRKSNRKQRYINKSEYLDSLTLHYEKLVKLLKKEELPVYFDTAHGMGGVIINELKKKLKQKEIIIINETCYEEDAKENSDFCPDPNLLNVRCGADFIVTKQRVPENISVDSNKIKRCASFDGDADRLIYFSTDPVFSVIDGDRMAVFLADYIYDLVQKLFNSNGNAKNINIGVVLSHYSNSAAVLAVKDKINVALSKTGVKEFIIISKRFDIGIFFEPNGHGSVIFSTQFINEIEKIVSTFSPESESWRIASILECFINLFDPCVGDAVANFLVFESLFERETYKKILERYINLPTRMLTVKIKDKNVIKIINNIEVQEPKELQHKISELCKKYKGRAFVRPSGTEDLVRIFAEAARSDESDALCVNVAQAVFDICEGIGFHPVIKY